MQRTSANEPDQAADVAPNGSGRTGDSSDGGSLRRQGIVHDLRNLLQVLSSGVSIAGARIEAGRSAEVPEILGKIGEAVIRANVMLGSLQSPCCCRPSVVDVGELLARQGDALGWALGTSNELVIAVASDLPLIRCSHNDLENVLLNLVINARDAMPRGGRVTIEASRGSAAAIDGVFLRVHDTGTGMSIGIAAKAFDPYFTTKDTAGHGLGLAMVAAFARSIGGSVQIEHASARGTTIALHLPCASSN